MTILAWCWIKHETHNISLIHNGSSQETPLPNTTTSTKKKSKQKKKMPEITPRPCNKCLAFYMVVLIDIFSSKRPSKSKPSFAGRHKYNMQFLTSSKKKKKERCSELHKRLRKVCNRNYFNFQRYYDVNNMTDSCGECKVSFMQKDDRHSVCCKEYDMEYEGSRDSIQQPTASS